MLMKYLQMNLVSHKRLNDEEVHSTLTLQPPLFTAIEIQKYEDAIKISPERHPTVSLAKIN